MTAKKYALKRGQLRLQVLVTHRCNAVCDHCDKGVGYFRAPDLDMTEALMRKYVDQAIDEGLVFHRVSLSGGEPVVNKELQGIINETARFPGLEWCRVLSNDLNSTKEQRAQIVFPDDRFNWTLAPLDDSDDPKSGKNKPIKERYRRRVHHPYWISPNDHGVQATFEACGVRNFCGRGLDANGYSMCGQAPILGRILNIDPYQTDDSKTIRQHCNTPIPDMCKHCMYGASQPEINRIQKRANRGEISMISPTFDKVFGIRRPLVSLTGNFDED